MAALLKPEEDDDVPLTEDELRRALAGTKTTAPGDDGLTYQVLCLLQKVPGNSLATSLQPLFPPGTCAFCLDLKYDYSDTKTWN